MCSVAVQEMDCRGSQPDPEEGKSITESLKHGYSSEEDLFSFVDHRHHSVANEPPAALTKDALQR